MSDAIKNSILNSDVNIVGGVHIGDESHFVTYKIESDSYRLAFEELNVDKQSLKGYLPPVFAAGLLEKLKKSKVVIIGGGHPFNTGGLMRYLASSIIEENSEIIIKESIGLPNLSNLLYALRRSETACMYLISKASPELLEFNFEEIKKIAFEKKALILISTDTPSQSWHFTANQLEETWFEINIGKAYQKEQLIHKAQFDLKENSIKLPGYYDVGQLVGRLKTPENINLFVNNLINFPEVTTENIEKCLAYTAPSDGFGVTHWFLNLPGDHKLIAIGFAIFSGLREIEFFEAMDILIEEGWKGRNHHLKPIDYNDILPLLSYFKIENGFVGGKYPGQEEQLLNAAWKTHRRFLDSALPVIERLVVQSTSRTGVNWRLFGNNWRRQNLRKTVANALTKIGEIDFRAIENTLLYLAAFDKPEIRMVSAETLANLRLILQDSWYKIINQWQKNLEVQNLLTEFKENIGYKMEGKKHHPLYFVQATIATTLGIVAQLDHFNRLDPRVLDQVARLARMRNEVVTQGVQQTLRTISAKHTRQVAPKLKSDFLQHATFIDPIAAGLADGYNNMDPAAVRAVLFGWLDEIHQNPAQRQNHVDFFHEDKVVCCIALTLQLLDYKLTLDNNRITVEEAYQALNYLRGVNHQPRVRGYLLRAIITLIEENMRTPNQMAINYITNLDMKERDQLVDGFLDHYISQRAELQGGEYQLILNDRLIASWENQIERPKTSVERLMKDWLSYPDKAINQIATLALLKIAEIEEIEKSKITSYLEEKQRLDELEEATEAEAPSHTSTVEATEFTQLFIKLASQVVRPTQIEKLHNISPILLQTNVVSDAQLTKLLVNFDDISSDQDKIVLHLIFLYNLFKGKDLNLAHNPFASGFWASVLLYTSPGNIPVLARNHFSAWAPILIQNHAVNKGDIEMILYYVGSWGEQFKGKVKLFRWLYRNGWTWYLVGAFFLYLLIKSMFGNLG